MDIGRIFTGYTTRSVPPTGSVQREQAARAVDPADFTPHPEYTRRTRQPDRPQAIEGELLQRNRHPNQPSTQDFLDSRRYQADSAESYQASTRAGLSSSNRQALGQYLNHVRPETRQSLVQGRTVDAFV